MAEKFKELQSWMAEHPSPASLKIPSRVLKGRQVIVQPKKEHHIQSESITDQKTNEEVKGPQITYRKENDILTGIVVTCSCGEVIEIEFDYDDEQSDQD